MRVFLCVYEVSPLPGNMHYGGVQIATVRSHVRAENVDAAKAFAEQWITHDGWEIVSVLTANSADPSGFGASTAESQGHCFDFDLTRLPESFLEDNNLLEENDNGE